MDRPREISRRGLLRSSLALAATAAAVPSLANLRFEIANALTCTEPGRQRYATFNERRDLLIDVFACTNVSDYTATGSSTDGQVGPYFAQARFAAAERSTPPDPTLIASGIQILWDHLDPTKVTMNAFLRWALIDTYLRYNQHFPSTLKTEFRVRLANFDYSVDGNTDNQRFMALSAGYLVGQTWPASPTWPSGKEGTYQRTQARNQLFFNKTPTDWTETNENQNSFANRFVHRGSSEFNTPSYHTLYINTMLSLYQFADQSDVRTRALMLMEWFFTSLAAKWHDGYLMAATARPNKGHMGDPDGYQSATVLGWLCFDAPSPKLPLGDERYGEAIWVVQNAVADLTAIRAYRPPAIIERIATDRASAFTAKETHYRGGNGATARVTSYLQPGSGVASEHDGTTNEMNSADRWFVRWHSSEPGSTLWICHPDDTPNPTACDANWYQARTPYEQVLQYKNVLAVVYNIPTNDNQPFIEGPFSTTAIKLRSEQSGWIFCHGGSTMIAVKLLKPYVWTGQRTVRDNYWCADPTRWASKPTYLVDNLRSDGTAISGFRKNGVVVEAHPVDRFFQTGDTDQETLDRFKSEILNGTTVFASHIDDATPRLVYWSLDGDELDIKLNGRRQINNVDVDYALTAWPLISAAGVSQGIDDNTLVLTNSGTRTYNFNTNAAWSIT